LRLGALPPLPKVVRSGCQAKPKTLPNRATALGPAAQQDPILLCMAEPDPKHYKTGLRLADTQTH